MRPLPLGASRRTWLGGLMVCLTGLLAVPAVPVAAGPVQDEQPREIAWLATGDSYSSGEGTSEATGACQLSDTAYPPLARTLLEQDGWSLQPFAFAACTGLHSRHLYNAQDDQLGSLVDWGLEQGLPDQARQFDLVTMTFGGNDIGFGEVVRNCMALGRRIVGWLVSVGLADDAIGCTYTQSELEDRIKSLANPPGTLDAEIARRLPDSRTGSMTDLYSHIHDHLLRDEPDTGELVVLGYPRLFTDPDDWSGWTTARCAGIRRDDARMLNQIAETLDETLGDQARQARSGGTRDITYLSVLDEFQGNELCGQEETWLTPRRITRPKASLHPNDAGHAAKATLLHRHLASPRPLADRDHRPHTTVRDVDWMNRSYEIDCLGERTITVVDGQWSDPEGPGHGPLEARVEGTVDVEYGQVDGHPGEVALVSIRCGIGAGTVVPNAWVFGVEGGRVVQLGQRLGGAKQGSPRLADGGVETTEYVFEEGDSRCCPSGERTHRWVLRDGRWSAP